MAFRPPVFNLFVGIYDVPYVGAKSLRGYCPCQLRGPLFTLTAGYVSGTDYLPLIIELLLPKGTDVRTQATAPTGFSGDIVEVSPDTGRFYQVMQVEDKAAGFANEYRIAFLQFIYEPPGTPPWPRVDSEWAPPGGGPWIPPYTGP
jgi:hypothetical protein